MTREIPLSTTTSLFMLSLLVPPIVRPSNVHAFFLIPLPSTPSLTRFLRSMESVPSPDCRIEKKQPIYISIGPQCSGKTTLLSQLQERITKDSTQRITDVTLDDQAGVYLPVKLQYFIEPETREIPFLNRRVLGKTVRARQQEQIELTAVLKRLTGKITRSQFQSTITNLYRNHTLEVLTRKNTNRDEVTESMIQSDYHSYVASDLIQVVEEFCERFALNNALPVRRDKTSIQQQSDSSLPPQIQLFVVEALFRPDFKTNLSAVDKASAQLHRLAQSTPPNVPLAWGNTNTRPREYATALSAAEASGRPVYFLVYGGNHRNTTETSLADISTTRPSSYRSKFGLAKGIFALPQLLQVDLLRRNLKRLLETGKYVPAKGIRDATIRVERLTESVLRELDKEAWLRQEQETDSPPLQPFVHSKFDFDRKLAQLANYEMLENRTVRYKPPQTS